MAAQLTIPYEGVLELVAQLSAEEQRALLIWLQRATVERTPSPADRRAAFRSLLIETPILVQPSLDRADWYDERG